MNAKQKRIICQSHNTTTGYVRIFRSCIHILFGQNVINEWVGFCRNLILQRNLRVLLDIDDRVWEITTEIRKYNSFWRWKTSKITSNTENVSCGSNMLLIYVCSGKCARVLLLLLPFFHVDTIILSEIIFKNIKEYSLIQPPSAILKIAYLFNLWLFFNTLRLLDNQDQ